jgi:glutaconate CoA-transferase subunit A
MFQLTKSIDDAIAPITDGCMLVVPREVSGVPMAATRALIRRGVKQLYLVALPTSSLQADLLIGAGCIETLETSAVSLGEFGPAPRFTAAVISGTIKLKDATCPALHAALQASEKGVPFMPLRGVLGSDLLKLRQDWKVIDNPMQSGSDPILLVPAIQPDIALFHARWADEEGNVWIGRRRELATIAHASKRCFVTYEDKRPGDMLEDELLAPGVISSTYVSGVARAEHGAWPLGVADVYGIDDAHLVAYAATAKTREGFERYLDEHVWQTKKNSLPA